MGYTTEWEAYAGGQARRWLGKVRKARELADALQLAYDQLRRDIDGIKAVRYDGQGGGSCQDPTAKMDAAVSRLDAARAQLAEQLGEAGAMTADAVERLARIEDATLQRCLALYYVQDVPTWGGVARIMGYSKDGMAKVKRRAWLAAYDVMPHAERDAREPAEN